MRLSSSIAYKTNYNFSRIAINSHNYGTNRLYDRKVAETKVYAEQVNNDDAEAFLLVNSFWKSINIPAALA